MVYEFVVGEDVPGYATTTKLEKPIDEYPGGEHAGFLVGRDDLSGDPLPMAYISIPLNELMPGEIFHRPPIGGDGSYVASVEEFNEAVGC